MNPFLLPKHCVIPPPKNETISKIVLNLNIKLKYMTLKIEDYFFFKRILLY